MAMGGHRDVVIAPVGEFLLAFDAARVEQIAQEEAADALDAGALVGLRITASDRRLLRIDGGRFLVGPEVHLERLPAAAFSPPPAFLDGLWRRLGVRSLVRTGDRLALGIDVGSIPGSGTSPPTL